MTADELWNKLVELSPDKPLSVEEFSVKTGLSKTLVAKVYERWVQMEKLRREHGHYVFVKRGNLNLFETPKSKEFEEIEHKLLKKEFKENEENEEKKTVIIRKKKKTDLAGFMRVISGIIGTVLMITSINFTYIFNKSGMNSFWGMLLSVSIVSFMCFAFTIRSYMSSKFNRVGVVILCTLVLLYSVFTAVSGQYNSFRKYNANDDSTIVMEQKELTESRIK
jgi:DNA-binding transcriptional regulator YhcF (GntR family)